MVAKGSQYRQALRAFWQDDRELKKVSLPVCRTSFTDGSYEQMLYYETSPIDNSDLALLDPSSTKQQR